MFDPAPTYNPNDIVRARFLIPNPDRRWWQFWKPREVWSEWIGRVVKREDISNKRVTITVKPPTSMEAKSKQWIVKG